MKKILSTFKGLLKSKEEPVKTEKVLVLKPLKLPTDYEIDKLAQSKVEGNAKRAIYIQGAKDMRDILSKSQEA